MLVCWKEKKEGVVTSKKNRSTGKKFGGGQEIRGGAGNYKYGGGKSLQGRSNTPNPAENPRGGGTRGKKPPIKTGK